MASRKLTALPTATEVTTSDKIYIVDVSDTTESPQGTSKQALISELPSTAIPLAGTETGSNVTGDIVVNGGVRIKTANSNEDAFHSFYLDDGGAYIEADGGSGGDIASVSLSSIELNINSNSQPKILKENNRYVVSVSQVDPTTTAPEAPGLLNIQGTTIYISTGSTDPSDWKQIFPAL